MSLPKLLPIFLTLITIAVLTIFSLVFVCKPIRGGEQCILFPMDRKKAFRYSAETYIAIKDPNIYIFMTGRGRRAGQNDAIHSQIVRHLGDQNVSKMYDGKSAKLI